MFKLDEALLCFEECLKLDSNNYKALAYKGLIFNDQDKFEKARECLDEAFLIKEDDDDVLLGLSMNYYRSKDYKKALEYSDMLFAVDPEHYTAFYVTIFSLLAMGKMGDAFKMLNKALKVHPDDECFLKLKDTIIV